MSIYNKMRRRFQREGYFTGGLTTAQSTLGDTVETNGRAVDRNAVPPLPSDSSSVGVDNLYLTRALSDNPTPGGTTAWIS